MMGIISYGLEFASSSYSWIFTRRFQVFVHEKALIKGSIDIFIVAIRRLGFT